MTAGTTVLAISRPVSGLRNYNLEMRHCLLYSTSPINFNPSNRQSQHSFPVQKVLFQAQQGKVHQGTNIMVLILQEIHTCISSQDSYQYIHVEKNSTLNQKGMLCTFIRAPNRHLGIYTHTVHVIKDPTKTAINARISKELPLL